MSATGGFSYLGQPESTPVVPTTTITPLFDNADVAQASPIDGWLLKSEFSTKDLSCSGNRSSLHIYPMGVCMNTGDRDSNAWGCTDNKLSQDNWHIKKEDAPNSYWPQCDKTKSGVEENCQDIKNGVNTCHYNDGKDGKKWKCTGDDSVDLGTTDTLALCLAACDAEADADCEKLHWNQSTKACTGCDKTWSDAHGSTDSDEDYFATDKSAMENFYTYDCATADSHAPGGIIVNWKTIKHDENLSAADCTATTDDKLNGPRETYAFIFDKCVPNGTTSSIAVHCVSDKAYFSSWANTDCSGTPGESTEIKKKTCTLSKDTTSSYMAEWWGACDGETKAPVVEAECLKPATCTLEYFCENTLGGVADLDASYTIGEATAGCKEVAESHPCADLHNHFTKTNEDPDEEKKRVELKTEWEKTCCAGESSAPGKFLLVAVFGSLLTALASAL